MPVEVSGSVNMLHRSFKANEGATKNRGARIRKGWTSTRYPTNSPILVCSRIVLSTPEILATRSTRDVRKNWKIIMLSPTMLSKETNSSYQPRTASPSTRESTQGIRTNAKYNHPSIANDTEDFLTAAIEVASCRRGNKLIIVPLSGYHKPRYLGAESSCRGTATSIWASCMMRSKNGKPCCSAF